MRTEAERFNVDHPDLCHCLRWKGMLVGVERDPTVPHSDEGLYWCVYTQTCIGPDGKLAEPGECSSSVRACHGKGHV
ncbi:MAG: hypothetical protein ACREDR_02580 [Blastocatellia bacterium]